VTSVPAVYRVQWLRARARYDRWAEEEISLAREMKMVVQYFASMTKKWTVLRDGVDEVSNPGHRCYAAKQSHMWATFGHQASVAFDRE